MKAWALGLLGVLVLGLLVLLHGGLYETRTASGLLYRVNRLTGSMVVCGQNQCVPATMLTAIKPLPTAAEIEAEIRREIKELQGGTPTRTATKPLSLRRILEMARECEQRGLPLEACP